MSLSPFEDGLQKLSMLDNEMEEARGLYFLNTPIDNPQIKIHIEEAKKYNPTAIYVTKFENGSVKPQIYIYDNTSNQLTEREISEQHKRLWNAYKVPMFFVFTPTEVKVFNCLEKPDIKDNGELEYITPLEIINLTSSINKEFKAQMFDSGAFWNSKYKDNFSFSNSVYESLLDELKLLRDNLIEKEILSIRSTESLLIKTILLRYLEERGIFDEGIENKKPYWNKFKKGAVSFTDLFDDNKAVVSLLDDLNVHFNGGVFDIGKESSEERIELLNANLKEFQYFLKGNKDGKQLVLWSRYSFKDLPIELISNIYELFLKSEDKAKGGVVYTPPILVNFMIDEIMPLDKPQKDFKLIDPSCGSGVFLVGAYKRLIQWWMIENDWERPSPTIARNIIKKSIYGVDKEEGAVQLSVFSLVLALCDTFLPNIIWNKLKFDNLEESKNVVAQDFFEYIQEEEHYNTFDLVIGNPPFVKWAKVSEVLEEDISMIPNQQLSFLFLSKGFQLLKEDAFICMVQPSAFLYSENSFTFRNQIFEKYKCHQIIDFACLNNSLFKRSGSGADVAVSVSFIQNKKSNVKKDNILHITVRNTFLAKEKIYFDLTHYDFHWLRYKDVLTQKSIWKSNLMGGSRISSIIRRLEGYPTLMEYLKSREKDNWIYLSGFKVGNKKYTDIEFLINKPTLPTDAFTEDGINYRKIKSLNESSFESPRVEELFQPPLVLIKNVLGKQSLLIEYIDIPLTFKIGISGIHAPLKYKNELKRLVERLKDNNLEYMFYLIATSGRVGVSKATSILKKDIDLLPYVENDELLRLSKIEEYFASDTIKYMMNFCKGNKNSPILKNVTDKQLDEFQLVYCELLNSTYDDFKSLNSFETESFIGCSFYYKDKPKKILIENSKDLEENLFSIINHKIGQNVNIKRVLRFYDDNVIYIIKPKQYRFWLKSIAVRDADETFSDLVKMGY
ncbi:MAG: Unknown protein [uncultured Sulfurovum sp.]|uniref:site-specific DNA-methyltransferase (adenine-specific) n=1 Tax=uncultured Sulfurovum sp. TaxID=269237 RepID=A0A6S6U1N9_9BACT|nr:MAG: Unknown protein [uncultured Sulfurovum sp.]